MSPLDTAEAVVNFRLRLVETRPHYDHTTIHRESQHAARLRNGDEHNWEDRIISGDSFSAPTICPSPQSPAQSLSSDSDSSADEEQQSLQQPGSLPVGWELLQRLMRKVKAASKTRIITSQGNQKTVIVLVQLRVLLPDAKIMVLVIRAVRSSAQVIRHQKQ